MQEEQIALGHSNNEAFSAPSLKEDLSVYEPTPNNPPWGIPLALLTWIISVFLLTFFGVAPVFVYALIQGVPSAEIQKFAMQPDALLVGILGTIPAHLLTLVLCWRVATNKGNYPASKTLGFEWGGFNLAYCIIAVILFYVLFGSMIYFFGSDETDLTKLLASSRAATLVVAFLAVVTAPLVEELVYRGLVFPSVQRSHGAVTAVLFTTFLFALVHVPQYITSWVAIVTITMLSLGLTLIRWKSKNILPCIVAHLIFNGVQAFILVIEPYLPKPETIPAPETVPALIRYLF